jgi:hypothetical protein
MKPRLLVLVAGACALGVPVLADKAVRFGGYRRCYDLPDGALVLAEDGAAFDGIPTHRKLGGGIACARNWLT